MLPHIIPTSFAVWALVTSYSLLVTPTSASAAVPQLINFQGRLTDPNNNPRTGTFDMTFKIFDALTGGTQLWTETQTGVQATNGVFSVQLGASTAIPITVFEAGSTYLEVTISPDPAMTPRQKLVTSPYAFNSATLMGYTTAYFVSTGTVNQTVGGVKTFTSFPVKDGSPTPTTDGEFATKAYVDGVGVVPALLKSTNTWTAQQTFTRALTVSNTNFFVMGGKVGIGTTAPSVKLHVESTDGLVIPVGVTGERPGSPVTGTIRYNTTTSQFEGYGGSTWGSLGGLIDVDQDTYISAETSAGANNDELRFITAGSTRAFINSTGKVGIGTTGPAERLEVKAGNIKALDGGVIASSITLSGLSADPSTATDGSLSYLSSGKLRLRTGGAWVDITTGTISGAVVDLNSAQTLGGVKTFTSFPKKSGSGSDLVPSADGEFATKSYVDLYSGPVLLASTNTWTARQTFTRELTVSNTNFFVTGGNVLLTGGQLGIGTTSPGATLDVSGNLRVDSSIIDDEASNMIIKPKNNQLNLYNTDWASLYSGTTTINGSACITGNVGIGTTVPAEKLEVKAGNIKALDGGVSVSSMTLTSLSVAPGSTTDKLYNSGGSLYWNTTNLSGGGSLPSATEGYTLRGNGSAWQSASSLFVKSDGKVGIGTTAPGAKFEVVGGSSTFRGSDSNSAIAGFTDASGNYRVVVSTSGNVGIGTTAPAYKLDITGDINIPVGSNYRIGGNIQSSASKWTMGTGDNIYRLDGNVGIGTSDPGSKLVVSGGSLSVFYDQDGAFGNGASISVTNPDSNSTGGASSIKLGRVGVTKWAWVNDVDGNATDNLTLWQAGDGKPITVLASSGNVGIGTTNPSSRFEVVGGSMTIRDPYGLQIGTMVVVQQGTGRVGIGTTGPISISGTNTGLLNLQSSNNPGLIFIDSGEAANQKVFWISDNQQNLDFGKANDDGTSPSTFMRIGSSGNVGIGTTSPDQKFHILGGSNSDPATSGTTQTGTVRIQSVVGLGVAFDMGVNNNNDRAWLQVANAGNLSVNYSLLLNPNGGNVGIGTTSPGSLLHVLGNALFGSGVTSDSVLLSGSPYGATHSFLSLINATTYAGILRLGNLTANSDLDDVGVISFHANAQSGGTYSKEIARINANLSGATAGNRGGYLVFRTKADGASLSSERMRIDKDGNVGIGTTSPANKLEVNGVIKSLTGGFTCPDGTNVTTFAGAGTGYSSATDVSMAADNDANGTGVMTFATAGAERMRITNAGNVGIATTSPTEKLHIAGGNFSTIRNENSVWMSNTGADGAVDWINNAYYSSGWKYFYADEASMMNMWDGKIAFHTAVAGTAGGAVDFVERMRINLDGNVGIGTTSPSSRFEVVGGSMTIRDPYGLQIGTMVIVQQGTGNVGIGTTSPQGTLHVANSSGATQLVIDATGAGDQDPIIEIRQSNSGGSAQIFYDKSLNNLAFQNSGAGNSDLVINTTGNVGIGTTGPLGKVQVVTTSDTGGIPNAWDDKYFVVGASGNAGGVSLSYDQTANVGKIQAASPGVAYRNLALVPAGGNVGIGTTAPDSKLHISGSGATTLIAQKIENITNGEIISIYAGYTAAIPGFTGGGTSMQGIVGWKSGSILSFGTYNADPVVFVTYDLERVRITGGGNVGIGTVSPGYKLDVNGSFNATSVYSNGTLLSPGTGSNWTVSGANIYRSAGNVGIGTTGPGAKLQIDSTSTFGILFNTSDSVPQIVFQNAGSSNKQWSLYQIGNDFRLNEGGVGDKVTFQAGGNVGIGTTAPSSRFEVVGGSMTIRDPYGLQIGTMVIVQQGTGNVGIGTTGPGAKLHVEGANANPQTYPTSTGITRVKAATTNVVLDVGSIPTYPFSVWMQVGETTVASYYPLSLNPLGGNVGIGTTAPAFKLDVNGIVNATSLYVNGSPYIGSQWTTSGSNIYYNTGNVGIGTTAPGALFEVSNGGGAITTWKTLLINRANMGHGSLAGTSFYDGVTEFARFGFGYNNGSSPNGYYMQIDRPGSLGTAAITVQNNGNVGIGTTAPFHVLTVAGNQTNAGTDNLAQIMITGGGGNTNARLLAGYDTTNSKGYIQAIHVNDDYKPLLLNPNGGNVGIGTTSPANKLEVNGVIKSLTGGFTCPDGTNITTFAGAGTGYSSATDVSMAADNDANGTGVMTFATAGAERMRITNDGNVGIGTTGPGAGLHVYKSNSDATPVATFENTHATTYVTMAFFKGVSSNENNVMIGAAQSSNNSTIIGWKYVGAGSTSNYAYWMNWGDSPGQGLVMADGGNVGIGTTAPAGQLALKNQISGSLLTYAATNGVEGQSIFNSYYTVASNGDVGPFPRFLDIASVGSPDGTNGGGVIRFLTNPITLSSPAVERMRIASNGNVGIGTTGPGGKQHIYSSAGTVTSQLIVSTGTTNLFEVNASSVVVNVPLYTQGGAGSWGYSGSDIYYNVGKVGIGIAYPASELHVYGIGSSEARIEGTTQGRLLLRDQQSSANKEIYEVMSNDDKMSFSLLNDTEDTRTYLMTLNSAGNVGIGTTGPLSKLEVNGNVNFTGAGRQAPFAVRSADQAYEIEMGFDTTDIHGFIQAGQFGIQVQPLTLNPIGGHVGIGDETPDAMLEISASGSGSNLFYLSSDDSTNGDRFIVQNGGNVGIGTTVPLLKTHISGGTTGFPSSSGAVTNGTLAIANGSAYGLAIGIDSSVVGSSWLQSQYWATSAVMPLLLNPLGGNVGIGTTNPGYKLDVSANGVSVKLGNNPAVASIGTIGAGAVNAFVGGYAGNTAYLGQNVYNDGAWQTPDAAAGKTSILMLQNGEYYFYTGTTGTGSEALYISNARGVSIGTYADDRIDPGANNLIVSGNVGIGTTAPSQKLHILGTSGSPATSGTTQNGIFRVHSVNNPTLDFGWQISPNVVSWIQATTIENLASTYPLALNPNGGNVGIGTTSPGAKLHVNGAAKMDSITFNVNPTQLYFLAGGGANAFDVGTTVTGMGQGAGKFMIHRSAAGTDDASASFIIDGSNGYVGIKTTDPGYTLTVAGTAWCTSGSWTGSDRRWKKDITPLNDSLSKVMKLQGVGYNWKTDEYPNLHFDSTPQIGLIAQDTEKVIPEVVTTDNNGYKGISYEKLTPVLVEAIKEQQNEIASLKLAMTKLEQEIKELKELKK